MDEVKKTTGKISRGENVQAIADKEFTILCINLSRGGTERQISYISTLPTCKKVICLEAPQAFFDTSNLEVIALSRHTKQTSMLIWLLSLPFMFLRLIKEIKKEKKLPVISFLDKANLFNLVAKIFVRHHCIIAIRTDIVQYYHGSAMKGAILKLLVRLYRKADDIVFNSQHAALRFQAYTKGRQLPVHVIGNAFPVHEIRNKAMHSISLEAKAVFAAKKVLVTVGNTHIFKGHWHLLRIFAALKREVPDAALMIIGDGDMYAALLELAQKLNLAVFDAKVGGSLYENYDVYFWGQQPNPFSFVLPARLFTLTSILEGSPNVLNEALICEKRVVAADCNSGPKEILAPSLPYSQNVKQPYYTPFGVLMPPFESSVVLDDSSLSATEMQWVNVLVKELRAADQSPDRERYRLHCEKLSHHIVLTQWQEFINGRAES